MNISGLDLKSFATPAYSQLLKNKNAVLEYYSPSSYGSDPETGNIVVTSGNIVRIEAILNEDVEGIENRIYAGIDEAQEAKYGRLVSPRRLPLEILHKAELNATIDGINGKFIIYKITQNPYGVAEILGEEIRGIFRRI